MCLCGAILNLKALFRSDSRHSDRVDSLLECAQWQRNQIIRGFWLLAKKKVEDGFMLTWCNSKFDGVLHKIAIDRNLL